MLVRKSDGGFNYATTDLAAIRHRIQMDDGERADRVLYVTDSGQSQHFDMVFATAKLADYIPDGASLEHVPFGLVQGEDGKKFATRSGDTVKLRDLLDEAVRIASEDIKSRSDDPTAELSDDARRVAEIVGVGAVKYADLSMNRESNYRFSYGRMLSLNGNTAPYMLYAYARLCGIIRKATNMEEGGEMTWPDSADILISNDAEMQLVRALVKLPDVLGDVEKELYPNRLCDYLFETSQKFNQVSVLQWNLRHGLPYFALHMTFLLATIIFTDPENGTQLFSLFYHIMGSSLHSPNADTNNCSTVL